MTARENNLTAGVQYAECSVRAPELHPNSHNCTVCKIRIHGTLKIVRQRAWIVFLVDFQAFRKLIGLILNKSSLKKTLRWLSVDFFSNRSFLVTVSFYFFRNCYFSVTVTVSEFKNKDPTPA